MVDANNSLYEEFLRVSDGLTESPEFKMLGGYRHHYGVSRMQHCINVAYFSFVVCRYLRLDYKAAARAGLLHDLFYFEWNSDEMGFCRHAAVHSKAALVNAEKLTCLSDMERDIIRNHMWLCGKMWPRYAETYIVSIADKICAVWEAGHGMRLKAMNKIFAA